MLHANPSNSRLSIATLTLGTIAAFAIPALGQEAPAIHVGSAQITGLPDDWSHRHVVFSNPGTEQEAIGAGRHEQWQRVVNDPRYVVQQLKNGLPVQGPAAIDAEYRAKWLSETHGRGGADLDKRDDDRPDSGHGERSHHRDGHGKDRNNPPSSIKRDWSMALGGPGLALGQYPAKYSFKGAANCNDYVIYPTGAAGTAAQATLVAFTNIYVGTGGCAASLPTVYWAFNTPPGGVVANSATANLSPVLSYNGDQVAFVETYSSTGYLVILKMASEPTSAYNNPSSALAYTAVAGYKACPAPCYTTISLGAADTSSAPFYDYSGTDTLYVGDNTGKVHEVTGVFSGTPAIDTIAGWPATASSTGSNALSSPVYDSGASNRIFVTDAGGYLHTFTVAAPGTVTTSGQLEHSPNVFGPPVVDSTTELVYTFIGYSGDTANPSYINRFSAAALAGTGPSDATGSGFGTGISYGNGSTTTNPSGSSMGAGSFDNTYYTGTGTTGNLYTCENGVVYQIPLTNFTSAGVKTFSTPVSTVGIAATCSPVTEFLGVKLATTLSTAINTVGLITVTVASTTGMAVGDYVQIDSEIMLVATVPTGTTFTVALAGRGQDGTTPATHTTTGVPVQDIKDWLFTSVAGGASGNAVTAAGCSGACVFNYNVINSAATTGNPTAGLSETGATSGIVIDNQSTTTGAQQIYFSTLVGHNAVQASQAALQ